MTTWTQDQDDTLRRLWDSGLSTARIANEIGGHTKNAVCGRARRLSLPQRQPSSRRRVRSAMAAANAAAKKPLTPLGGSRMGPPPMRERPLPPPLRTAFDDERRAFGLVHLLDLEPHHCRFAIGYDDKLGHGFCGCTSVAGTSWCEYHLPRVAAPLDRAFRSQRGETRVEAGATTLAATVQEFLTSA